MNFNKYMNIAGVPPQYSDEIYRNMEQSRLLFKKLKWYKLTAPFWLIFICLFLKWEDEYLTDLLKRNPFKFLYKFWPKLETHLKRFDNNISINGDRGNWVRDDVNGVDYHGVKFSRGPVPLEDTPEARAKNYYAFGLHPRHNLARYVWLGWRNKASNYAKMLGPVIDREAHLTTYEWNNGEYDHVTFYFKNGYWQMMMVKKYWKFLLKRNLGYKVNNVYGDLTNQVQVTYKDFAVVKAD